MRFPLSGSLLGRLAGAAAASGLVLTGLVATAGPASAAACSGTSGVTVVVDTGSSISTRCASDDPSSAMKALLAAGYDVDYPDPYPGSVVCRIDGFPSSDPCRRMPPANAYWAFFHAQRGGGWTYSQTGAGSYNPAPGSVVGFRFGSGQQPRTAPPAKTTTSTPKPAPKPTTAAPKPTRAAPKPTTAAPKATTRSTTPSTAPKAGAPRASATPGASATAAASPSASSSPSASTSASASASPSTDAAPSDDATPLAAGPTSDDGSGSLGTLLGGGALVALVAGGAGWAAWKRRGVTG